MKRPSALVDVFLVLALLSCNSWTTWSSSERCSPIYVEDIRPHSVSITEFGAVGDGVTLNTKAFQNAIFYLNSFADKGGAKLFVPAGQWLTGSFDLISHLTLWLDKDAVILGSTNFDDWPIVDPLPSYGRGRELPGERHKSLIYGYNLTDVIITGNNGTIDGQGSIWWSRFRNKTLDYTRPHLVELMNSSRVLISNLTFLNSPFWNIHPVYCSHVTVQNVTIHAPSSSPNTDGINPGIGIKTARGRGGYVRNVYISKVTLDNVDIAIRLNGLYKEHPDDDYNPDALPVIERITIKDVIGENVKRAGLIQGIKGDNFLDICLSNITLSVTSKRPWNCSNVEGYSDLLSPEVCDPLKESIFPEHITDCYNPENLLRSSSTRNEGSSWLLSWREEGLVSPSILIDNRGEL
ncbi:hypothetical protein PIB30_016353 [Stylosanthes scabra]|uniref:Polygalacturonase n=1 Tax=Stylosanthes scabra TaxID=79078 RepID=A0ABU6T8H2_9FABA|nr:hypothetical protein [Stylosanthes scabra]